MCRACFVLISLLLAAGCSRPLPAEPPPAPAPVQPAPLAPAPTPAPAPPPPTPPPSPPPAIWRAGIWLDGTWLEPGASAAAVEGLTRDLARRGVTDLYVRTGPFRPDGTVPLPDPGLVARLHRAASAQSMRLWAWLPGWRPRLALEDGALLRTAAASAVALARTGFDGIQLDVEPTPDGDEGYLALLDALRAQLPPGAMLGAATHLLKPQPEQAEWSPAYFARVAMRVDQAAVMAYDTYAHTAEEFRSIVTYQTVTALRQSPAATEVLIGVPTYEDRTERHTPETEPTRAGLQGVADGFGQVDLAGRVTGWALYAHFTTDDAEWQAWAERPR